MRWRILTLLFVARMSMAFQFAAIGAVGPLYEEAFEINAAGLGFLIGIYFMPGIVAALPGGTLGSLFGDRRVVSASLALIVAGALVMALMESWEAQMAGRVIAGTGAVVLNVLMTKMVADWFAGREIATAMAIFVNSWPAGIAAALVLMPALAGAAGLSGALLFVAAFTAVGFCLISLFYRSPGAAEAAPAGRGAVPRGYALGAILSAGAAWGFFNASLAMVFSFGPANLVERGSTLVEASAATSLVIWSVMVAGFAGGVIADATGRPVTLLVASILVMLAAMYWFPLADNVVLVLIVLGVATGLPTGVFMSLAAQSLLPAERAMGMGIFWTVYYVLFSVAPWIAGRLIDIRGGTGVAFEFGAALLVLVLLSVLACRSLQRRQQAATVPG